MARIPPLTDFRAFGPGIRWRLHQALAAQLGQAVGSTSGRTIGLLPPYPSLHGLGTLGDVEALRYGGQSAHGRDYRSVASFIEIQARQSSVSALARFGPAHKLSLIPKTHVRRWHAGYPRVPACGQSFSETLAEVFIGGWPSMRRLADLTMEPDAGVGPEFLRRAFREAQDNRGLLHGQAHEVA